MPFKDRSDVGRMLANALVVYRDQKLVILALPRGGVPVAAEVASALRAPLDLVLVRKIGTAMDRELVLAVPVASTDTLTAMRGHSRSRARLVGAS